MTHPIAATERSRYGKELHQDTLYHLGIDVGSTDAVIDAHQRAGPGSALRIWSKERKPRTIAPSWSAPHSPE